MKLRFIIVIIMYNILRFTNKKHTYRENNKIIKT